ncbi:hypothetical protein L6452_20595 [Arctium lappa]|uniref:Uncharacterized protein n=1 Tax=Arctium lappa TaxID=4217 RepID=A0ACB9BCM6_ARCLA|nr:hypothetical protein L6452_20595 [Arctium lappa]
MRKKATHILVFSLKLLIEMQGLALLCVFYVFFLNYLSIYLLISRFAFFNLSISPFLEHHQNAEVFAFLCHALSFL